VSRIEDIQVEGFWETFLQCNPPPPDVSGEDLALARAIYMSGFGAMMALACHLHDETPEVRSATLTAIRRQLEPSPEPYDLN
jgi:hypothetical protein